MAGAARRQGPNQPLHRLGERVQFLVDGVVHADGSGSGQGPVVIARTKVNPNRGRIHGSMGLIAAGVPESFTKKAPAISTRYP